MRNFDGPGLLPATNRIGITQADPQLISMDRSTQLPIKASFAGPTTSSPLIINNQNTNDDNYHVLKNMSITGYSPVNMIYA